MGCLAEMTVAHPTSGSFGAYAEHYISPLAGFVVRYAYWGAVVLAVGMEVTAVGKYMAYWFPAVDQWVWVLLFSVLLAAVNATSVWSITRRPAITWYCLGVFRPDRLPLPAAGTSA